MMEDEIRESLILTQEQLDELASVFKSVMRTCMSLSGWALRSVETLHRTNRTNRPSVWNIRH